MLRCSILVLSVVLANFVAAGENDMCPQAPVAVDVPSPLVSDVLTDGTNLVTHVVRILGGLETVPLQPRMSSQVLSMQCGLNASHRSITLRVPRTAFTSPLPRFSKHSFKLSFWRASFQRLISVGNWASWIKNIGLQQFLASSTVSVDLLSGKDALDVVLFEPVVGAANPCADEPAEESLELPCASLSLEKMIGIGESRITSCTIREPLSTTLCVRIGCTSCRSQDFRIQVEVSQNYDVDGLWWVAGLLFLVVLGPFLIHNVYVQTLFCAIFGVVIVVAVILYFGLKDVGNTRFGKVGLGALMLAGGTSTLTRGAILSFSRWAMFQVQASPVLQMALLVLSVAGAGVSHWFLKAHIDKILLWTVRVSEAICVTGIAVQSPTLFFTAAPFLALLRWFIVRAATLSKQLLRNADEPRDQLPRQAYEPKEYAKPVCEALHGTPVQKDKAFRELGASTTRREMEKLAAFIRASPSVASRLRAPNDVFHFAGTSLTEDDDF